MAGGRHGGVEALVPLDAPSSAGDLALHERQGLVDGGEVDLGPPLGGQRRQLGLERVPGLDDFWQLSCMSAQRPGNLRRPFRLDQDDSVAVPHGHHADDLHRDQRLADGRPADTEPCGELPLRRQPVADLEAVLGDPQLDLAHDLLVQARSRDRPEAYSLGLTEREIITGMNGDLILTLVGVTYLCAIARNNGTVDLIVRAAVRAVGGRVALIPWVMFGVTAVLTAIGAVSPAACAIIGPIALGFAGRHKISPLMMGMFVVHGAQAGGFSPISIYGVITNSVMEEAGLPSSEITVFLASLIVNTIMASILFVVLGGRKLMAKRIDPDDPDTLDEDLHRGGAT